ncbi:MAG: hypothetical protein ACYC7J_10950 [Syntrophales bacterium]
MATIMKRLIPASVLLWATLFAVAPVSALPLYFPHVDTTASWQTEIAIINSSPTQIVTGTLRALDSQGQLVGEAMPVTLPAHGRRQITIANEFINHTSIRYVVFDTSSSTVQGYTKFFIQGSYRAAVPAVKEVNTGNIYITHIDSGTVWWTGIALVNTTAGQKSITITFNNGQTRQATLNPYEHRVYEIARDFFGNQPQPGIRSAVITNASGVIGLELFGTRDGKQLEGIPLTDRTASILYYPHVDTVGWWTGIVAYNPSATASTITITPYSVNAVPLSNITATISGGATYVRAIPLQLSLPPNTAWFKLVSSTPLAGFELFGSSDGNQLGSYAGNGTSGSREGIFAKIEKSGWTGIAFVNTDAGAASVTLTAYNDGGTAVATKVLTVNGYEKKANQAEALFSPQNISSATYIAYTSDKIIVGFQLDGSSDWKMLDGLPTLPRIMQDTFTNGGAILRTNVTTSPTSQTVVVTDSSNNVVLTLVVTKTGVTMSAPGEVTATMTFRQPLTSLPTAYAARRMAIFAAGARVVGDSLSVRPDSPGCDWFPDSQCTLGCCADHDKCYRDNNCGASSWVWGFGSDACENCNNIVYDCIGAACAGVTDSFTQNNCYDGRCNKYYDCPPNYDNCACVDACASSAVPATCGNGRCEEGENLDNCFTDCAFGNSPSSCCVATNNCPSETPTTCPGACCCCGYGFTCNAQGQCGAGDWF